MRRICAVIGRPGPAIDEALARQRRQPEVVVRGEHSLREGLADAIEAGAEWIWLLDGVAAPRPDALSQLVDALARVPRPDRTVALAGVVRDPTGSVERSRAFWFRSDAVEPAMAVANAGLLPIRATAGPALVRRDAVSAVPPPAAAELSPIGLFPWTARLLTSGDGYLVAASEHDASEPTPDPLGAPGLVGRLILGGSFGRIDRLRLAYELASRLSTRREGFRLLWPG